MSRRISGLNEITSSYKAILCDVWGVLHNGVTVYHHAADALENFRNEGGHVVMLTNSPRPKEGVYSQLSDMGVNLDAFDDIVTSGDATRALIAQSNGTIFHLGPSRDLPLFDGLDVSLSNKEDCEIIVCTGLRDDETEVPEDYRDEFLPLVARNVPFVCANPDLIVERGDRLIPCAGSLAKLYEELDGKTLVAGKPHEPIYKLGFEKLNLLSLNNLQKSDVIAVGDGMPTDVAGAINNGFDLLYISAGIHSNQYGAPNSPNEEMLHSFFTSENVDPTVWMPRLVWGT